MNDKNGKVETSLMNVNRSEVWLVNLDPTIGSEIRKTRPVVVISSNSVGILPIRLVAPFTEWHDYFENNIWHVKIVPDHMNGLGKTSAIDTLQLRGVDKKRFLKKLGIISPAIMESIVAAIGAVIEY